MKAIVVGLGLVALLITVGSALGAAPAGLDAATEQALLRALDDERRSEALYRAVLDEFGEVLPFAHVIQAEQRHQQRLTDLFERYSVQVPANPWEPGKGEGAADGFEIAATLQAACQDAMEAEKINIALYDDLLAEVEATDVRAVFEQLQSASRDHHLVAFGRCAEGRMGRGAGHRGGNHEGCCGGCCGGQKDGPKGGGRCAAGG
jgi:hypothetical protein